MAKKNKIIPISILCIIVLGGLIYYWGFIYSFRNFAGQENWKPIKEYNFPIKAQTAEQKIYEIVAMNEKSLSLADSTTHKFTSDGWFTAFVAVSNDTTEFIFGIAEDNLSSNLNQSSLRLFHIIDKSLDINPNTIKNINKEALNKRLSLFEKTFINNISAIEK